MNNLKKLSFLFILGLAFVSCKNDEGDEPEQQASAPVAYTTAFTATVSGTISGVTYDELSKGQRGILYSDNPDNAESFFESWRKGNNNPGCLQVGRIKINANGTLEVSLTKLKPETAYTFCLYYLSTDGNTRLLSPSGTFTTKAFDCKTETAEAQSVGLYKAMLSGSVTANLNDLALCRTGIAYSDKVSEPTLEDGYKEANETESDGNFTIGMKELRCGIEYSYRTYVQVEHTGEVLYGPVKTFTTRHPDELVVDLGLSVKWASCNLGAEEPQETGGYYKWGETEPSTDGERSRYSLWNSYQNKYVEVGNNICATEYDAAHEVLAGHWRMPTKAEIEELVNSCEMTLHTLGDFYVAEFTGNGASICIPASGWYNSYGRSGMYEKDKDNEPQVIIQSGERSYSTQGVTDPNGHRRWCWYVQINTSTNQAAVTSTSQSGTITGEGGGTISTGEQVKLIGEMGYQVEFAIPIRPVWDPALGN